MNYYIKDEDKFICLLCSHYCRIDKEQVGICGINKNTGNKIECLAYGYPKAINIDPIEKKPLYHFLPGSKSFSLGTNACNFRCSFCQNWSLSQEQKIKKENYFSPEDIVNHARNNSCESISFTYNEPTIFYPYAKDIAVEAKKFGIKSVFVSNGFESKEIIEDMTGIIDAVNIDLKTFDEKYYKKLGGNLKILLQNLKSFVINGIHLEITTLIVPSKNDSFNELVKIARFINDELGSFIPWHISAFHPDYKEKDLPRTSSKSLEMAKDIGKKAGLKYVYVGNSGFENITYCKNCKKSLIKRDYFNVNENLIINGECPNCYTTVDGVFNMNEAKKTILKMNFSGTFYSDKKNDLTKHFSYFNNTRNIIKSKVKPKAIIVPHAGYIYSGSIANSAYRIAKNENYKRAIVIGPSHRHYLDGVSVGLYDEYETPIGNLSIDKKYASDIIKNYEFASFDENAHMEHSTETQMPFLRNYFEDIKVVEIVYGKINYKDLSLLIKSILKDKDNLLVISSDLSHFYTQEEANILDSICIDAIKNMDIKKFDEGCEACGETGIKALVKASYELGYKTQFLDYCTSYDVTKDSSRVVGYTSFLVGETYGI